MTAETVTVRACLLIFVLWFAAGWAIMLGVHAYEATHRHGGPPAADSSTCYRRACSE